VRGLSEGVGGGEVNFLEWWFSYFILSLLVVFVVLVMIVIVGAVATQLGIALPIIVSAIVILVVATGVAAWLEAAK
jgi:hypothetical protein